MKRLLSVVLALLMVMMIMPLNALSASAEETYAIKLEIVGKGHVDVQSTAVEGEEVVVTMTADEGWFVREMLVNSSDEQITKISYTTPSFEEDTDGFTMPGDDVTLRVTFAEPSAFTETPIEEPEPEPHNPGDPCTITFDPNGGYGSMPRPTVDEGSEYTLPECGYTKEGRDFYKWSIGGVECDPGDTVIVNTDITVKAVWKHKTVFKIDNSVDLSTTTVTGILKLTDLRTGETTDYTITDETASSEFTQPRNPNVNAMVEEAKEALQDRLILLFNKTL